MAKTMISVAAVMAAMVCVATSQQVTSPYERGPHNTSHLHVGSLLTIGLEENLDVWVPSEPGTYEVFYFLDGFGGVIPAEAYTQTMEHLASHGLAVVAPWKLTAPLNPEDKVPLLVSVIEWVESHLESKLHHNGVSEEVHLDLENLIAGSHSAGAHVFVEYLKSTCGKFKAQVFMSPVDGMDAEGLIPIFCITPGETLNYAMPTLLLAAGLDSVGGFTGYSCAPDFLSNDRFYDAQDPSTPRWFNNATEFGHGDCLDPLYQHGLEATHFCAYNSEASDEELGIYRRFVAGQIVSFYKALYGARETCHSYLSYLEDPSVMIVDTTQYHDNPTATCPEPQCTWWPEPGTTTAD